MTNGFDWDDDDCPIPLPATAGGRGGAPAAPGRESVERSQPKPGGIAARAAAANAPAPRSDFFRGLNPEQRQAINRIRVGHGLAILHPVRRRRFLGAHFHLVEYTA